MICPFSTLDILKKLELGFVLDIMGGIPVLLKKKKNNLQDCLCLPLISTPKYMIQH